MRSEITSGRMMAARSTTGGAKGWMKGVSGDGQSPWIFYCVCTNVVNGRIVHCGTALRAKKMCLRLSQTRTGFIVSLRTPQARHSG